MAEAFAVTYHGGDGVPVPPVGAGPGRWVEFAEWRRALGWEVAAQQLSGPACVPRLCVAVVGRDWWLRRLYWLPSGPWRTT